jgi:acetoin utilization deacetylase AcuC-like enzyme
MVAESQSFSPSAAKPAAVVASWRELGIPMSLIEPTPVTRDELVRAHDVTFVDDILAGRLRNGFGNTSAAVAASLQHTSGAMLAAAREALRNRAVAVAPCSGFHHAGYAEAAGYCTFNGLMVAALAMRASGEVRRVGILDFDEHYGDGTDRIIEQLKIDWIVHHTEGKVYRRPPEAEAFLARIATIVEGMRDCDVILYQAGADPHVDDPLGGWLSTEQLHARDRLAFSAARRLNIPVAWNLAGGYQNPLRKVLDIHDNTMRACASVYRPLHS